MKWWKIAALVIGTGILGGLVIAGCAPNAHTSSIPASRPTLPSQESTYSPQVVTPTPTPTPTPPPPWYIGPPSTHIPPRGPTPLPPELWKEQERQEQAIPGRITRAGPETKGATITIAGKKIKLPDDVYWDGIVGPINCLAGIPCGRPPMIIIVRGKSTLGVNFNSGQITGETIAPGEDGAFAFLDKELPLQVTGPRTSGTTLRIAGKDIKLPADAYVGDILSDKDMVPGRDCVPPPKTQYQVLPACPKLPLYGIVRQGAGIWISAVDGSVHSETIPYGKGIFDSIKEALK